MDNYIGNIDLSKRPIVEDGKGGFMTELSFGFAPDENTEVLIPQVVGGKLVSKDEAIKHFFKTGEHLGVWDLRGLKNKKAKYAEIEKYAVKIHERQEAAYAMQHAARKGL